MDKETQTQLGHSLLKSLVKLKESKGNIRIEDLGDILAHMADSLNVRTAPEQFLRSEFQSIAERINEARNEILSLIPQDEQGHPRISDAHDQLDAVVKMTDEASTQIMDAADTIQNAVDNNDANMQSIISDAVANIYLACNFQDITGQRITKVVHTLQYIDDKIHNILKLFSELDESTIGGGRKQSGDASMLEAKRDDEVKAGLLSGPALPDNAPTQDDIDALFATIR